MGGRKNVLKERQSPRRFENIREEARTFKMTKRSHFDLILSRFPYSDVYFVLFISLFVVPR